MSITELAMEKDEAIRVAMHELANAYAEYLVTAQSTNPNIPIHERNMARVRASSCQRALHYFRNCEG